jgi:integrase
VSRKIQIKGLRGTIYKRGDQSYRVQLSLGRNTEGKYDVKRETIRGTKQDAIELLTRWNVEYLDNTIIPSNHQTVAELYKEWIKEVVIYLEPNTHRFYKEKWESFILGPIGHKKLSDVTLANLQRILRDNITQDKQIKNAMSPFFSWCVKHKKIKENPCFSLRTKSKPKEKTEDDVWDFDEVRKIYETLTFENLYDIFIVLGVECSMRPQEILGLKWDKVFDDYIAIERAVKKREPSEFILGPTKTNTSKRYWPLTPFVKDCLEKHRKNQLERIKKNKTYVNNNLVVADKNGNVPCLRYIGRYIKRKAAEAGVSVIPPKNLRTTHISLMNALGVPLPTIQQGAGHEVGSAVTAQHYIRTYQESLRGTAMILHERLHRK